jgi:hypothetical protein
MEKLFGYDYVDGKLVVNVEEAKIIRTTFEKVIEYTDHPPKVLVDRVIEISLENGESISYEDAEKRVSYSAILEYISKELNVEFGEMFEKHVYHSISFEKSDENVEHQPIVSKEQWDKVQEKIKSNK